MATGCANRLTKAEFYSKCGQTVNYNNTITGNVFYQGTKKGYDYFLCSPFLGFSDQVAVAEGEVSLARERFPFSRKSKDWLVCFPDYTIRELGRPIEMQFIPADNHVIQLPTQ